jgi:hypothetical protein
MTEDPRCIEYANRFINKTSLSSFLQKQESSLPLVDKQPILDSGSSPNDRKSTRALFTLGSLPDWKSYENFRLAGKYQ